MHVTREDTVFHVFTSGVVGALVLGLVCNSKFLRFLFM